jgi:hypothetical protein
MKIRMIQTTVQELQVDVPDTLDSLVNVMQEANRIASEGGATPLGDPKDLGCQVTSIVKMEDEKEVVFMVQRMGQMVVTEEGGMHFNETREATLFRKKQMEEAAEMQKQQDAEKPSEERTN